MKLILVAFLALASSAQAILISSTVSGDENTFHAEFSFSWPAGGGRTIESGSWDGGTFTFDGSVFIVPGPPNQVEMLQGFYIDTFWNDGWNPALLGSSLSGTNPSHEVPLFSHFHHSIPPNPFPDSGPNDLQYSLDASAFINLTLLPDRSGHGVITYDLSRSPMIDSTRLLREQARQVPDGSNVPDGGSSLLMFASAFGVILFRSLRLV